LLKAALAHGFTRGFLTAALILVASAVILAVLMNTPRPAHREPAVPEA
jgi:hypothetical protein